MNIELLCSFPELVFFLQTIGAQGFDIKKKRKINIYTYKHSFSKTYRGT